jgi:hypothetical protein
VKLVCLLAGHQIEGKSLCRLPMVTDRDGIKRFGSNTEGLAIAVNQ